MRVHQCLWLWTSLLCMILSNGFLCHHPTRTAYTTIPSVSQRPVEEDVLAVKVKIAELSDLENMGLFFLMEEGYSTKSMAGTIMYVTQILREYKENGVLTFIAFSEDRIVGTGAATRVFGNLPFPDDINVSTSDQKVYLSDMLTSKQNRRRGIGTQVLKSIEAHFGPSLFFLFVERTNASAVRMYSKLGFSASQSNMSRKEYQELLEACELSQLKAAKCILMAKAL